MSVPGHTPYRVGGENGLLDRVRVEGGTVTAALLDEATGEELGTEELELGYDRGQILLAPAERADVVLIPNGQPGDELVKNDGRRAARDVATMLLVGGGDPPDIGEGYPVLEAIGRAVEPVPPGDDLVDFTGDAGTVLGEKMEIHPFHLHGFSYQPVALVRHPDDDEHMGGMGGTEPEARGHDLHPAARRVGDDERARRGVSRSVTSGARRPRACGSSRSGRRASSARG